MGQSIGALWTNHKGEMEYYKGNVRVPFAVRAGDKIKIVVFANTKKDPDDPEQESWPDYNILLDAPRRQG